MQSVNIVLSTRRGRLNLLARHAFIRRQVPLTISIPRYVNLGLSGMLIAAVDVTVLVSTLKLVDLNLALFERQ